MKNAGKLWAIGLWVFVLVCVGYYLVLHNLSFILAAEKVSFKMERILEAYAIKPGQWAETVRRRSPLIIQRQAGGWALRSKHGTLQVTFSPALRIRWEKPIGQGG